MRAKALLLLAFLTLLSASAMRGQNGIDMTVTIDGDWSDNYQPIPIDFRHGFSFSQQIYTAGEIGTSGTITSIAFEKRVSAGTFTMQGMRIYMMHTDKERFLGLSDFVPFSDNDLVFEGTFSGEGFGWITLTLDTPFEYDGQSNLLIVCEDNLTNNYTHSSSQSSFRQHKIYSDKTLWRASNSATNYNYYQYGDLTIQRNSIQLHITIDGFLPPVNLAVNDITDFSATLTWDVPPTSYTITGYTYQYRENASFTDWSAEETTTDTLVTLTGLEDHTDYEFRVKTLYGDDESHFYAETTFTTLAVPLPTPTVIDLTDMSATVSWNVPQSAYTIMGYAYCYKKIREVNWSPELTIPDTTVTITGLSPSTDYQFKLRVVFSDHISSNRYVDFTTFGITLPNLSVSEITDMSATVSWEPPQTSYTITGYAYQYKKSGDANWTDEVMVSDATTSVNLNGLLGDTEYQFRAKVIFSDHEGVYTDISFTTLAIPLPNLAVSELTETTATLTWDAPQTSYTITGYDYQYKKSSDANWSAEVTTANPSATLTELLGLTQYQFRAKAIFTDHESSFTETSFTTTGSLPTLAVSEIDETTATLTWDAPQMPYTITGYAYQYNKTSDAD